MPKQSASRSTAAALAALSLALALAACHRPAPEPAAAAPPASATATADRSGRLAASAPGGPAVGVIPVDTAHAASSAGPSDAKTAIGGLANHPSK